MRSCTSWTTSYPSTLDVMPANWAEAKYVVDMAQGFHSLYLYTDLIDSQPVGNACVPLLRVIPLQQKHGEMVTTHFQNIYYMPLSKLMFDTIHMYIRDDTGKPVPFERGKLVVTLHFRPRRSLYLS